MEQIHYNPLPVQVFWGWAEAARWLGRGLWVAAGCAAVWSDVGEGRCGRPAAAGAGAGGDDDDDDDVAVDREDDNNDVVGSYGSTSNEAHPHLLRKEKRHRWRITSSLSLSKFSSE